MGARVNLEVNSRMKPRILHGLIFHIDTNLINAHQRLEAVNKLERWCKDELIVIIISSTAHGEALAGGSECRTKKANQQIFTATDPVNKTNKIYKRVEMALFPKVATNENQRNDVRIVCEAIKYRAILVTNDGASNSQPGGILGNRDKLRGLVQIMSSDEAVALVRTRIRERDDFNKKTAEEIGGELPSWTDKD